MSNITDNNICHDIFCNNFNEKIQSKYILIYIRAKNEIALFPLCKKYYKDRGKIKKITFNFNSKKVSASKQIILYYSILKTYFPRSAHFSPKNHLGKNGFCNSWLCRFNIYQNWLLLVNNCTSARYKRVKMKCQNISRTSLTKTFPNRYFRALVNPKSLFNGLRMVIS